MALHAFKIKSAEGLHNPDLFRCDLCLCARLVFCHVFLIKDRRLPSDPTRHIFVLIVRGLRSRDVSGVVPLNILICPSPSRSLERHNSRIGSERSPSVCEEEAGANKPALNLTRQSRYKRSDIPSHKKISRKKSGGDVSKTPRSEGALCCLSKYFFKA